MSNISTDHSWGVAKTGPEITNSGIQKLFKIYKKIKNSETDIGLYSMDC